MTKTPIRKMGKGFEQVIHRRDASGQSRLDRDIHFHLDRDLNLDKRSSSQSGKVRTK